MSDLYIGQHVSITNSYETLQAVILELRGKEVLAQELNTRRIEIFGTHMCKPLP
jgi:hypothetical protein